MLYAKYEYIKELEREKMQLENIIGKGPGDKVLRRERKKNIVIIRI